MIFLRASGYNPQDYDDAILRLVATILINNAGSLVQDSYYATNEEFADIYTGMVRDGCSKSSK